MGRPASPLPDFVAHCAELLAPLGAVRTMRMFGGWGLYVDELFVAIVADERLFLKTDEAGAARHAAAGCEPFCFIKGGETITTHYWSAPADAMDSPALMQPWARSALQAALAARARPRAARRR